MIDASHPPNDMNAGGGGVSKANGFTEPSTGESAKHKKISEGLGYDVPPWLHSN